MKKRYEHLNAEERATIMVMKGQNAGYNIKWLMRVILQKGIKLFCPSFLPKKYKP